MTAGQIAELVLRYVQVLLNWPVAVLALGIIAMALFRKPFSDFLSRVTSAGGYGFQLSAANPQSQAAPAKKPEAPELANVIEHQPPRTEQGLPMVPQQVLDFVRQNPARVVEDFQRIFNSYRHERTFNLIFGTQIDMLQFLATKGTEGEAYINLAVFYGEYRRRAKETKYQMPDYVRFLNGFGLIEYFGADPNIRVRITPNGLGFLSYIRTEYSLIYDKRPL